MVIECSMRGARSLLSLHASNVGRWRSTVNVVELVQGRFRETLLAEDIRLEPPRQVLADLVSHVSARRHGEDVVELFERTLLGLRQPQEAEDG